MGATASNVIIIAILAAAFFFAAKSTIAHFKGEGACCGGGSRQIRIKPKKLDHTIEVKIVHIKGMMCDHCAGRVHNALNSIDGVNAKVNLGKEQAVVKLGREIAEKEIEETVTQLGYTVVSIENRIKIQRR